MTTTTTARMSANLPHQLTPSHEPEPEPGDGDDPGDACAGKGDVGRRSVHREDADTTGQKQYDTPDLARPLPRQGHGVVVGVPAPSSTVDRLLRVSDR